MIKPRRGGGEVAMRIAAFDLEVAEGLGLAQGRSQIFVRRRPRSSSKSSSSTPANIEIQVLGDKHGNVTISRARMFDPAPQPEGHRGGAVAAARRNDPPQDGRASGWRLQRP